MEETKEKEVEIRLKDFLTVFLRCWWILLLVGVVVCGGLYGILKKTHVNEYTASATVYIIRKSDTLQASQVSISNALVSDYIESITMGDVMNLVRSDLNILPEDLPNKTFARMIQISNKDSSRIVTISVTAGTPADAVDLVDSLARNSVNYFNTILVGEKYSQYVGSVDTEHPENSVVISNPISKTKILLIGIAAVLIAYLIFFVMYVMDDKINTPEDVEKNLGINLLGQIPYRHGQKSKNKDEQSAGKEGAKA